MFGIRGVGVRAADDLLGGMRGMSLTKPANLPSLSTRQPYNLFPLCNHNTNWIVQYSTQLLYTIQVGIHRALSIRYLGNPSFTSRAPFSTSPKKMHISYHIISYFLQLGRTRQAGVWVCHVMSGCIISPATSLVQCLEGCQIRQGMHSMRIDTSF
jgi:hypothetical protein